MSAPILPLAGLQRLVFLINSRWESLTAAALADGETSPEVTSSCFAEFLNEGSPVRLRLLALSTCVGFKYGHNIINLRSFSWYPAHPRSLRRGGASSCNLDLCAADLPATRPQCTYVNSIRRKDY